MRLSALLGRLIGLEEDAAEFHLTELAMSHRDLANLLRVALKAQHPGDGVYCWVRDVYDDSVVYELSNRDDVTKLYRRTYSVDDAGAVTLGEPEAVVPVTTYVGGDEAARGDLWERSFTQDQRDAMAKSGQAMADGSFPIATKADLRNAVSAYGRAANKAAVKAHIKKRAKALDATDELPEDWREAAGEELTGDLVPLVERAVKPDGTIALRIIAPGQGSSGYYSPTVLKRDGPKVFTAGLHMHLDHPTATEESDRPERSIATLAGTLTSDARWEEKGAAGPGLYADARVRSDLAPLIEELAPHIGVSIRALGTAGTAEVDGKRVRSVEAITQAKSVDFVTVPGAGGRVLDLVESARQRHRGGITPPEDDDVSKEELDAAKAALAEATGKIAALEQWKTDQERQDQEAALLREAHGIVAAELAKAPLPQPTRDRLVGQLAAEAPTKDGAIDREALIARVKEAATAEAAYLASVTGGNPVKGMGGGAPDEATVPTLEESGKRIAEAIKGL